MTLTVPSTSTTTTRLLLPRLFALAPAAWSILLLILTGARSLWKRYAGGVIRLVEEEDDLKERERPLLSVFITDEDILEAAGLPHNAPVAVEEDPRDAAAAEVVLPSTPWAVVLVPLAETIAWTVVTLAHIVARGGPVASLDLLAPASHVFAWVSSSVSDAFS